MDAKSCPTAIENTSGDYHLLADIGRKLRQSYAPDSSWQLPFEIKQQLAVLDQIAWHSNRWYSLFDFEKFNFLYCSSNLPQLVGDTIGHSSPTGWDPRYLSIVQDHRSIVDFLSVRKRLIAGLPDGIRPLPVSSVCGGSILNLKNKHMRMHYKCTPLVSDASGNVVLSFDYMEDITTLMTAANGYWMRFNLNGQPAHWHSDRRKTVRKDILSPREKLLIGLCQKGHAIGEIAEMVSVSRQTAKNQLNTVRNRLFARDNTSLVQLSLLAGLLDTTS